MSNNSRVFWFCWWTMAATYELSQLIRAFATNNWGVAIYLCLLLYFAVSLGNDAVEARGAYA